MRCLLLTSILTLLTCQGFSDYGTDHQNRSLEMHPNGQTDPNREINSVHGCMSGFSIEGEFLWWRAQIDSLEYVIKSSGNSDPLLERRGSFHEPDFEFDPGVRVSLGYDFGPSNWDIFFRWTYHYTDPTNFVRGDGADVLLFPTRDFTAIGPTEAVSFSDTAHSKWTDRINVFDFEMGYDYFIGKRFSVRPGFGIKAAWIDMDNNMKFGNTRVVDPNNPPFEVGEVQVRTKTDYWGVGPLVRIDGNLHIGWGFSLYATAAAAFLYGQYDTQIKQSTVLPSPYKFTLKQNNYTRQRSMGQLIVGAEWAKCFCQDYMLSIHIGWEGQYWWNQNEFRYVSEVERSGDLTFTGLDVGARFDF